MLITETVDFLSGLELNKNKTAIWADLGCGEGFFTHVLAGMLKTGSKIYAIDKQFQLLKRSTANAVQIQFRKADFVTDELDLPELDGIMLANSLHYVEHKKAVLKKMVSFLKKEAVIVVIEYETENANRWVPYPIGFESLKKLFAELGYTTIEKIGECKSIYGGDIMYACTIKHK